VKVIRERRFRNSETGGTLARVILMIFHKLSEAWMAQDELASPEASTVT
jgi:hypothetical protein